MRHADAAWRTALGRHATRLLGLRNRVDVALDGISVKRHTVTVDVIHEDRDHIKTVIKDLETAGWHVRYAGSELSISVPEDIRNPPRAGDTEDGA